MRQRVRNKPQSIMDCYIRAWKFQVLSWLPLFHMAWTIRFLKEHLATGKPYQRLLQSSNQWLFKRQKVYLTWHLAAFHLSKPERSSIAKSPISCGISCNSIAIVVHRPTWKWGNSDCMYQDETENKSNNIWVMALGTVKNIIKKLYIRFKVIWVDSGHECGALNIVDSPLSEVRVPWTRAWLSDIWQYGRAVKGHLW